MSSSTHPLVIVKLSGGLGNQMFQYSAARRLAQHANADLKFDDGWFREQGAWTPRQFELAPFELPFGFASEREVARFKTSRQNPLFRRLPGFLKAVVFHRDQSHIIEKDYAFDPAILDLRGDRYLDGHWQSYKYFQDTEALIREDLSFKKGVVDSEKTLEEAIRSSPSVSLHIRRADYVSLPSANTHHGLCGLEYYADAVSHILKRVNNPKFFIFSDDIPWARANLKLDVEANFIEPHEATSSYGDMRLISLCRNHVIANSSFSWWGAWLSQNPEKIVIAPKQWFRDPRANARTNDLIPESWVRL